MREGLWGELSQYIAKHAVSDFACDATCTNNCVAESHCGPQLIECLCDNCGCHQQIITIQADGDYNYQALLEYSNHNLNSFRYFLENQYKF